jgi:hypothetical protein
MISILFQWRSQEPRRIAVWNYLREIWQQMAQSYDWEIVVADDGLTGGFNRARAYNRAFAASRGGIVIPMGANHLPGVGTIHSAAARALHHGWARTFDQVAALSPEDTDILLAGGFLGASMLHPVTFPVASSCAMTRGAWAAVGGYDERFGTGYGYEDAAMRNALAHRYGADFPPGHGLLIMLDHGVTGGVARITPANQSLFDREYADLAPELN